MIFSLTGFEEGQFLLVAIENDKVLMVVKFKIAIRKDNIPFLVEMSRCKAMFIAFLTRLIQFDWRVVSDFVNIEIPVLLFDESFKVVWERVSHPDIPREGTTFAAAQSKVVLAQFLETFLAAEVAAAAFCVFSQRLSVLNIVGSIILNEEWRVSFVCLAQTYDKHVLVEANCDALVVVIVFFVQLLLSFS